MRRLELGTTSAHEPGWETLDLRGGTYRQSAVDLSNFHDNCFERVVSTDLIEHIPWRDIPAALREWIRVLHPHGELHIQTPNAHELAAILAGEPTNSHVQGESPWQQFCRVAFGHQDYPENAHRSYFTPEWLTALLYEAGAREVWVIYQNVERFQLGARK